MSNNKKFIKIAKYVLLSLGIFLGVGLLLVGGVILFSIFSWNALFSEPYVLDRFADDGYAFITDSFDLPEEIGAELIEIKLKDEWYDSYATLLFSVSNDDAMNEYLSQHFKESDRASGTPTTVSRKDKTYFASEQYEPLTNHWGKNITRYVSSENGTVYAYTLLKPDAALREMVRTHGKKTSPR